MSAGMTLGQQAKRLAEVIRNLPHDAARRRINLAYVACSQAHGWSHLLKRFTIQTEAQYNTGTVSVVNASTGVTLTGGTWTTSWVTSPSMRRMVIQGRNEPYDVSALGSTTTATLTDAFAGTTDTDATYTMYRDTYVLPADCGIAKMIALYDPELLVRLFNFNQPKFLEVRSNQPGLLSIPECFTVVNQTTETVPRPQLQFYPGPSTVRVYHGWYFRRPDFLSADSSALDWPQEFDDMIWVRAALDHYRVPPNYSPKYLSEFKPMYADLYDRMKSAMDGQSAIDFQIEAAQLGSSGSGWNPDPSGLSGGGTISWG